MRCSPVTLHCDDFIKAMRHTLTSVCILVPNVRNALYRVGGPMQFRVLTAIIVFLGSYLPLSLILLAQDFDFNAPSCGFCWPFTSNACALPLGNPGFSLGVFAITLVCFIVTVATLHLIKPTQDIEVVEAKYIPTDLMNYTLPYIVSFMSIEYQVTGKFVGFLVFLGWMFWITYRSGQILLNPVLIALGWRLYEMSYRHAGSSDKFITRSLVKGELAPGAYKQWPVQSIQIIKPGS